MNANGVDYCCEKFKMEPWSLTDYLYLRICGCVVDSYRTGLSICFIEG